MTRSVAPSPKRTAPQPAAGFAAPVCGHDNGSGHVASAQVCNTTTHTTHGSALEPRSPSPSVNAPFDLAALDAALQRPMRRPAWSYSLWGTPVTTPPACPSVRMADYLSPQRCVGSVSMASPRVACEGDDDLAMCAPDGTPALVAALVWTLVNGVSPHEHIDALLEAGADVNAADDAGTTPLHLAAASGDLALLQHLLAVPSISLQPRLATDEQQTPRQLAEACGMAAAAEFLAEREALAGMSGQGSGLSA